MQRKTQVHIPVLNHGVEETESHKVVTGKVTTTKQQKNSPPLQGIQATWLCLNQSASGLKSVSAGFSPHIYIILGPTVTLFFHISLYVSQVVPGFPGPLVSGNFTSPHIRGMFRPPHTAWSEHGHDNKTRKKIDNAPRYATFIMRLPPRWAQIFASASSSHSSQSRFLC